MTAAHAPDVRQTKEFLLKLRLLPAILAFAALLSVPGVLLSPEYLARPELDLPLVLSSGGVETAQVIFGRPVLLNNLVALGVVGMIASAVLRLGLWWRARSTAGATFLVTAAILAVMPLVWLLVMLALSQPWYGGIAIPQWLDQIAIALLRVPPSWFWIMQTVALLLFVLGLMRAGLAAKWLGLIGVAAAILSAVVLIELRIFDQTSALYPLSAITKTLLLVGLAATLGGQALRPAVASAHDGAA